MKENKVPLVSIVTPSFNQGSFIRDTVESVLSQDYTPTEYLVMDGGSTDETVEILKGYGDRFFWVSEKDRGQADAINKGWKKAQGQILAYLNSDDVYCPGAISKAVKFFQSHPEAGALYGEGYHITKDGKIIERYPTEPFNRSRLMETCYICQPTVFIRKAVLEDVGFLDESLRYCMDYDLWLRISKRYEMGYLPEYLACTRFYSETKTLGQRFQVHKEILDMVCRHNRVVPPSWIYGYCHAFWERYLDRSKPLQNFFFILGLITLSFKKFIEYNHHISSSEFRRWKGWLTPRLKWNFFKPRVKKSIDPKKP